MTPDIHTGLRHDQLASFDSGGVSFLLVRVITGKDRSAIGLHARPHTFSTAGIQTTDVLSYLGFQRSSCTFQQGDGYCRAVSSEFDSAGFAADFAPTSDVLKSALSALEACGVHVPRPEGFGYFLGHNSRSHAVDLSGGYHGDGHTTIQTSELKSNEDEAFSFKLTYIKDAADKSGWVTHYAPRHRPLSDELRSIFEFVRMHEFDECPEFDFEQCYWFFVAASDDPRERFIDSLTNRAHAQFDANASRFSSGIEKLLAANTTMSSYGMEFLPVSAARIASQRSIAQVIDAVNPRGNASSTPSVEFDVVISFAGPDRAKAEELAVLLRDAGVRVFYDNFYPEMLWGKDLAVFFADIYRRSAKYCVIFVSREYNDRIWTTHERQHATARALEERGREYILPIKVENVEIPGIAPAIGYLKLTEFSIAEIASLLIRKLHASTT